jgi:tetratricopeptide (TPR) repeat protein
VARFLALLALLASCAFGAAATQGKQSFWNGDFDQAIRRLEKAVSQNPSSSDLHHWLGKSYGMKADTSNFLSAIGWAKKCRASFEKAVELDPQNVEAMADLMEFYLAAPGMLGGGFDKAQAMAERIAALDPAEGHYARSRLAAKKKDNAAVEDHLRKALALEPEKLGRKLDLAAFLSSRGRTEESEKMFAETARPHDPLFLFRRAQVYIEGKRNLPEARRMLEKYLAMNLTIDDPPRYEAEALLKKAR